MGHDNPNLSPMRGPSVWAQPQWDGRRTNGDCSDGWWALRVPRSLRLVCSGGRGPPHRSSRLAQVCWRSPLRRTRSGACARGWTAACAAGMEDEVGYASDSVIPGERLAIMDANDGQRHPTGPTLASTSNEARMLANSEGTCRLGRDSETHGSGDAEGRLPQPRCRARVLLLPRALSGVALPGRARELLSCRQHDGSGDRLAQPFRPAGRVEHHPRADRENRQQRQRRAPDHRHAADALEHLGRRDGHHQHAEQGV